MTVTTSYSALTYNCNGSTTAFAVTWPFFLSSDLVVTRITSAGVESALVLTSDYTVTGGRASSGVPGPGTVTTVATYADGKIRITRATPKTQSTSFTEAGAFPAKTVEAAIDRVTMIAEEGGGTGGGQDIDGAVLRLETGGATDYWDGESYIARGFADGVNDDDLATVGQIAPYVTDAEAAATAAAASEAAAAASETAAASSAASASSSASAASASATTASNASIAAIAAAGFSFTYSTTTTMADPGSGGIRFNNATLGSVTAIAINDLSADTGTPDVSAWILTFDNSTASSKGLLRFRKKTAPQNFVDFVVTGLTDNASWTELAVTYAASSGSLSNSDAVLIAFYATGDVGPVGPGSGDVNGPASSVDNQLPRYNGTTGKEIQQSSLYVNDSGQLAFGNNFSSQNYTKLLVSQNSASPIEGDSQTIMHVAGADDTASRVLLDGYGKHTVLAFRMCEGTPATPTACDVDAEFGTIGGFGYGSTGFNTGSFSTKCTIAFCAAEVWTDAAQGAYLRFDTTPVGSTTRAERLRLDSEGRFLLGYGTPVVYSSTTASFQMHGTSGATSSGMFARWSNNSNAASIFLGKSRGAAAGTYGIVQSGDWAGYIRFGGDDGSDFKDCAAIRGEIDGTPGTNDMPGRLLFLTTPDGSTTLAERLRITNAGHTQPGADNAYTLGESSFRWSTVYAATGTINTSDARDKTVTGTLADVASRIVDAVSPVLFKWNVGGNEVSVSTTEFETDADGNKTQKVIVTPKPGVRTHAGFLAQDIKAAMDAVGVEFAAWGLDDKNDAASRQHIRPDQLIPVLWEALRATRKELENLKSTIDLLR